MCGDGLRVGIQIEHPANLPERRAVGLRAHVEPTAGFAESQRTRVAVNVQPLHAG